MGTEPIFPVKTRCAPLRRAFLEKDGDSGELLVERNEDLPRIRQDGADAPGGRRADLTVVQRHSRETQLSLIMAWTSGMSTGLAISCRCRTPVWALRSPSFAVKSA
jgi:hypothetical protein